MTTATTAAVTKRVSVSAPWVPAELKRLFAVEVEPSEDGGYGHEIVRVEANFEKASRLIREFAANGLKCRLRVVVWRFLDDFELTQGDDERPASHAVEITDRDGHAVRVMDFEDPAEAFCRRFNGRGELRSRDGFAARVVKK